MDDKMNKLLWAWGASGLVIAIIIPFGVNLLMKPQVGAAGQTDTWISFFGSYIGSILSGLLTLIGVLLTINYTDRQNKIKQERTDESNIRQLNFTREENEKMLREARKETRRNKLPEMIYHLEEAIDLVKEQMNILDTWHKQDIKILKKEYGRETSFIFIDKTYDLGLSGRYLEMTSLKPKKIRNLAVKADTPAYEAFIQFSHEIEKGYPSNVKKIASELAEFRRSFVRSRYNKLHEHLQPDRDWTVFSLEGEEKRRLEELNREIFMKDQEYSLHLIVLYTTLHESLIKQLSNLAKEFSQ